MPDMPEIEKSMEERIQFFYQKASILPNNKFLVGLYGPYVNQALLKMGRDAEFTSNVNTQKFTEGNLVHKSHFSDFLKRHTNGTTKLVGDEVELKWATRSVTIPTIQSDIIEDINIDTIKTIQYPLIKGHIPTGTIKLDIVEDRTMSIYHFFNALMNRFFNPKILKPKSSFQKLNMYIIILNQDVPDPKLNPKGVFDIPVQMFEFNSIVPTGMTDLSFSHDMPTKKTEFSISFKAPNLFQSSYKTINEFRNIRNNSTDAALAKIKETSTDVGGMALQSEYLIDQEKSTEDDPLFIFEVRNNDAGLKHENNGFFRDDII